jgi:hypothetical protein
VAQVLKPHQQVEMKQMQLQAVVVAVVPEQRVQEMQQVVQRLALVVLVVVAMEQQGVRVHWLALVLGIQLLNLEAGAAVVGIILLMITRKFLMPMEEQEPLAMYWFHITTTQHQLYQA